jgi:hypothetical protein
MVAAQLKRKPVRPTMPFSANVYRVLIASPSDTREYRDVARRVVEDWTALHAEAMRTVLIPLLWERDATPDAGDRPQAILNAQLVEKADALVAIFWTKLGSPTGAAESGTVEEIRECIESGKPVLLYFSNQPVARDSVDPDELRRLNEFRDEIRDEVLFDTFADEGDFASKLFAALTRVAREQFGASELANQSDSVGRDSRADVTAQVDVQREMRAFNRSGKPQYRSTYTLIIVNSGSATAEDFEFHFEPSGDRELGNLELPSVHGAEGPISRFVPNSELRYTLLVHMGTVRQAELVMKWREGAEEHSVTQTLRLG